MTTLMQLGMNAGTIWHLLDVMSEAVSVSFIQQRTGLSETEVLQAIGWLAREGKIDFTEVNGQECVFLVPANIYF